jgi:NitT/TauT family transport system substrate-binding protein
MLRRKRIFAAMLPIFAAALAVGPVAAETTVTFASANTSLGYMAQKIAEEKGFFAEAGIKPNIVDFNGGGPAVQATAGGGADICLCTGDHVIYLRNNGVVARVLVSVTQFHSYGLVALASSPYTDLKSLKGQKIGITSAGSSTDNMIRFAITKAGLDPDKDFVLLGIGTSGSMQPAIATGAIGAGMLTSPDFQAFIYKKTDTYRVVDDFTRVPYPTFSVLAMDAWLKKNPETARGVAKGLVRALQLIHSNPEVVREYLKRVYPKFEDGLVEELVVESERALSPDGRVTEEVWKSLNDILIGYNPQLKPVSLADAAAFEFLPPATANQ